MKARNPSPQQLAFNPQLQITIQMQCDLVHSLRQRSETKEEAYPPHSKIFKNWYKRLEMHIFYTGLPQSFSHCVVIYILPPPYTSFAVGEASAGEKAGNGT